MKAHRWHKTERFWFEQEQYFLLLPKYYTKWYFFTKNVIASKQENGYYCIAFRTI